MQALDRYVTEYHKGLYVALSMVRKELAWLAILVKVVGTMVGLAAEDRACMYIFLYVDNFWAITLEIWVAPHMVTVER